MNAKTVYVSKPLACITILILSAISQSVWAHQYTGFGRITSLEAGWGADTLSVKTVAPLINPAGCSIADAGYVTSTTDPGRRLYHDMLRDAFWRNFPVRLLISGNAGDCPFNKPRIISVTVIKP